MSPTIGHISVPIPNPGQFEMRPYSDHLTKLIDQVRKRKHILLIQLAGVCITNHRKSLSAEGGRMVTQVLWFLGYC